MPDSPRPDRAVSSELRAGAARIDVTPDDLTGLDPMGFSFSAAHDPIHLRALVVDDGTALAALVAADLIEVGDTTALRARIEAELGIPAEAVVIAPSHSHSAPRIGLVPPGGKARIPSAESLRFTETVEEAMVAVLGTALGRRGPVSIEFARDLVDVNVNREEYVDGRWVHGINPEGPSDSTLSVVTLRDPDGEPVAVVLNYAVHPTTTLGLHELSADLVGVAAAHVERELGGGTVALWTSGALGDQAVRVELLEPSGDRERDARFAYTAAEAQGMLLGATAVRAVRRGAPARFGASVRAAARVVPCPVRRLEVPPGMEQALVDTVDLTLSCLRIGDVVFAGASGEVTMPIFRELQAASPLVATLMVSNANARIGYFATDEAYDRSTPAAEGCPIVRGVAAATIVSGLLELIEAVRAH